MTTVVVLPTNQNGNKFRAVSGDDFSYGTTVGEALDALTEHISDKENPVIFIQDFRPDKFFTEAQQQRMSELMQKWRTARDNNQEFPTEEQTELENLIKIELIGSAKRSEKIADELGR